ncbi:uncharacterized protein BO72DRAFT_523861 [Aspergillus fijiensis CBS 313.89]|uniref:Serine hydrolase domain-containing protein n=1 Tax=Aspergillus fijiensis CBS 313.89 TaxID=1448319 RepID=A0A8G1RZZ3_9EURO|nr:uncharacterized protein BO72DRAFT_523861 [Aspergillus fijiensis CBS 313.89]RAK81974.1 hypothetical protein BO72DRAFT_523861 [Aspergillus fijiensis CBS 313.89]
MKVLCLHGYGTNPDVLQHQLSALRRDADPSWEFVFLSGEIECSPAPGIEGTFPGPYYCWTRTFDTESVDAAHALIEEAIEENGPFDGVLGFSQGAAVIASFMLEHATTYPEEPGPFRFAIFCSPTIPCAADSVYNQAVYGSLSSGDQQRLRSGQEIQLAQLPEPARSVSEAMLEVIHSTQPITGDSASYFFDRPLHLVPSALHPNALQTRLAIPSLHLHGRNDLPGMGNFAALVRSFCDPSKTKMLEHSAGHDLPRSGMDAKKFLSGMEWVIAQSQLSSL